MRRLPQSTAYTVMLKLFLSSDHVSAATGKTVAIKISKAGGAFADPNAGASNATEVSNGWYKFALDTTDTNTLGDLVVRGTAASCDDAEQVCQVVSATTGGATNLDAAISAVKTKTDSLTFTVAGMVDSNVVDWKGATAPAMTGDAYARIGAPVGASISADIAGVQADTDNIQTRLPAALVSGRIDASVGAMAANVLTATAIAADAITDAKVASDVTIASVTGAVGSVTGSVGSVTGNVGGNVTGSVGSVAVGGITASSFAAGAIDNAAIAADAIGSSELAASAVTEIQSGLSTLDAAGVRAAVGMASANLDTQIGTLATASALATVAGYVDTEVAAIKAKTDNLPSDPADASDIAAAFTALQSHGDGAWATATGFSTLDAVAVENAVWDATLTDHVNGGSMGQSLFYAQQGATSADTKATDIFGDTQAIRGVTDTLVNTGGKLWVLDDQGNPLRHSDEIAADFSALSSHGDGAWATADVSNLPTNAELATALGGLPAAPTATAIADEVETRTLDANIKKVNGVTVTGNGTTGNEWGPA